MYDLHLQTYFFLRFGRSLRPRVFKTILLKHFEHVTLLHDLQVIDINFVEKGDN